MKKERLDPDVWRRVETRDRVCQAAAFGFGSVDPCWGALQVHHRLPRGRGGTNDPELLVLLCLGHHAEVESFRARAYACGLLLRSGSQT